MKKTIITLAAATLGLSSVNAQTIINGDFEDAPGTLQLATVPNGWTATVTGTDPDLVDIITPSTAFTPAGATGLYVEVHDFGSSGTLSQDVGGFIIGQTYELTFDWGNRGPNAGNDPAFDFNFLVSAGNGSFSAIGNGLVDFREESFLFTAASTTETIAITFNGGGQTGGAFDNFSVAQVAVPEPSSALLLGLSALGFFSRRKR